MSKSSCKRPLRLFILASAIAAAVFVLRRAVADQGGTYDPGAPA